MPRNMSFALTKEQFLNRTKTVTRRFGWWTLKPGDVVNAVEKAMGLKKGEKIKHLGQIRIVSVRKERLNKITQEDVVREGFPGMSPDHFVEFFRQTHHNCDGSWEVNRIEFERID
jgi:hypothetical protein